MTASVKQQARRLAMEQFQKRRSDQLARETCIRDLVVEATTAVMEREHLVVRVEQRLVTAIEGLRQLELPIAEVAILTGLDPREVRKLMRGGRGGES